MVLHPKVTVDAVLNDGGTPAAGGIARRLWASGDQGTQFLALRFGQFAGSSRRTLVDQTGNALPEETVAVVPDCLLAYIEHLRDLAYCHTIGHGE
jgi:hypothetical protein